MTEPLVPIVWADAARHAAFDAWLDHAARAHGLQPDTLRPASSDASFRRYFRIDGEAGSCIVMDAPPPQEDVRPFVHVAKLIADAGLNAPRILAVDDAQGFVLLGDLGTRLYLGELQQAVAAGDERTVSTLMRDACAALVQWQQRVDATDLPPYDEALLRREVELFPTWCVQA